MNLPRRLVRPKSWPVRWRLALVSSGLTLAILVLFGGLIGKIATERIRDDFNGEVSSAVKILAGADPGRLPAVRSQTGSDRRAAAERLRPS